MKTSVKELFTSDFYKALLDSVFDAVYTVDKTGKILYWNDSCVRITGYTTDEMVGQFYSETPFASYDENFGFDGRPSGVEIVLRTSMPGTWKGFVRRKNGQRIPVESHISPIRNEQGETIGVVEVFRDITSHVALEQAHQEVLQMARKDQLTGLYNRTAISELLKAEIERNSRYDQPLSVVMVDIDHFKRINDRYGHDAGDKVLARIGGIFTFNLRKPDAVGRWGGEEFLIIAPGNDASAAQQLAQRLRGFLKDIPLGQLPEVITASFGVAQLADQQSMDQLLLVADKAMYKAKNAGRDRVEIGLAHDSLPEKP